MNELPVSSQLMNEYFIRMLEQCMTVMGAVFVLAIVAVAIMALVLRLNEPARLDLKSKPAVPPAADEETK
ncbi:hypothetical protein A3C96_02840 [Candidatus Uhrbacteria bacterium RIFCSPHIGHO2_02_FULL_60_10]|uniref:Uncharacterized protein n=1 Tax=Candidatus Uhrbacteria bacterium RIFCSPHIGHO2_02_FULL_60_10 TaxID=1802392 RepID=A0A1F7U276_9BACT|nr:MAG: hypothetical protein A3C96_02840 [Candidatus Uhrbacteria bacterium RIFCSPHIGHO2_02_FULL_60_10]